MKIIFLLINIALIFSSCDTFIHGIIKNETDDTLNVIIIADTKQANSWDSSMYEFSFKYDNALESKSGFHDSKITWLPNKIFKSDFKIYPHDSIKDIMGGLGPANIRKIRFDTIIFLKPNGEKLKISGRENIFNAFKKKSAFRYYLIPWEKKEKKWWKFW